MQAWKIIAAALMNAQHIPAFPTSSTACALSTASKQDVAIISRQINYVTEWCGTKTTPKDEMECCKKMHIAEFEKRVAELREQLE